MTRSPGKPKLISLDAWWKICQSILISPNFLFRSVVHRVVFFANVVPPYSTTESLPSCTPRAHSMRRCSARHPSHRRHQRPVAPAKTTSRSRASRRTRSRWRRASPFWNRASATQSTSPTCEARGMRSITHAVLEVQAVIAVSVRWAIRPHILDVVSRASSSAPSRMRSTHSEPWKRASESSGWVSIMVSRRTTADLTTGGWLYFEHTLRDLQLTLISVKETHIGLQSMTFAHEALFRLR